MHWDTSDVYLHVIWFIDCPGVWEALSFVEPTEACAGSLPGAGISGAFFHDYCMNLLLFSCLNLNLLFQTMAPATGWSAPNTSWDHAKETERVKTDGQIKSNYLERKGIQWTL